MANNDAKKPRSAARGVGLALLALSVLGAVTFFGYRLVSASVSNPPVEQPRLEPVAPAPDPEWDRMVGRISATAQHFQGGMAVYLKDLSSGRTWELNADHDVPSASLIKVPIMAALLERVKRGDVSLDEKMVMTRGDKRGGSGKMRRQRSGSRYTVHELMYRMITESDNTAAHMIIRRLGMDYLQSQFAAMGLTHTNITPEGMSLDSYGVARENYTTAREMAGLLEKIYRGELVDGEQSALMMETMKHLRHATRFSKRLPAGWRLAHKTGMLRQSCHDAGIFFSPGGDYVMVVLSWNVPDYLYAAHQITKVAGHTFSYYRQFELQTARSADRGDARSS